MKVRIAYIEEPPFYWTGKDRAATGADIAADHRSRMAKYGIMKTEIDSVIER